MNRIRRLETRNDGTQPRRLSQHVFRDRYETRVRLLPKALPLGRKQDVPGSEWTNQGLQKRELARHYDNVSVNLPRGAQKAP